jgi:hypothetical protein
MGGRRAVHLVLGRDSLWCYRGVVVDRTPLRLIDNVRPSLGGRRLLIRTAQPGVFVTPSFNFRSSEECRIWHEALRSGRDRERAAPRGDPDLEKVSTGTVVLVRRQPTQRYQLLGQVEADDPRKKSARAGLITRARMMGAEAVVDVQDERISEPGRTLWRSTGWAIRAVDSNGRWQLNVRWFGSQVRRWTTFCLAYILVEFLFICLFYTWGIGKEMLDQRIGMHLPVTTLIASAGLMRLIPFALCVALHRLQWGQLVRPAASSVIILGAAPVVINAIEFTESLRSGKFQDALRALLYVLESLPDFAICLFFWQKLSGLRSDYRSLLLDEDHRPPYVRRILGRIADVSWVVYLVFILALAVSSILVPRSHLWRQRDSQMFLDGFAVAGRIVIGTALAGSALLAYRRWQGDRSYPSCAGHWLLLRALAVYATRTIALTTYWLLLQALAVSVTKTNYFLGDAGVYVSALIIHVAFLLCLRRHLPRHWVAVFLVSCIAAAIRTALLFIGVGLLDLLTAVLALFDARVICWAIGRDRRSGVPTDGLHRLGIATALALDALSAILPIYFFARFLASATF